MTECVLLNIYVSKDSKLYLTTKKANFGSNIFIYLAIFIVRDLCIFEIYNVELLSNVDQRP